MNLSDVQERAVRLALNAGRYRKRAEEAENLLREVVEHGDACGCFPDQGCPIDRAIAYLRSLDA